MRTSLSAFLALLVTIGIVTVMAILVDPPPAPTADRKPPAIFVQPLPDGFLCKNPTSDMYWEANARLQQQIEDSRQCRLSSDCQVARFNCVYGGPQAVHRSAIADLIRTIETFESNSCFVVSRSHCGWYRSGLVIVGADCARGRCEIVTANINPFPDYEELYVPPVEGAISLEGTL
jgi:hypothetical protein